MTAIENGLNAPAPGRKAARGICAISGKDRPRRDLVAIDDLRPSLVERIRADHPGLPPDGLISWKELARYRTLYVEELLKAEHGELTELDRQVAESMATHETLAENTDEEYEEHRTLGERMADRLASFGGSWTFIISVRRRAGGMDGIQHLRQRCRALRSLSVHPAQSGPVLTLAAIQAPVIMMSQKRQESKDRLRSENDYQVNLKAELEIRHLHEKMDHLISRQWQRLAEIQQMQLEMMHEMSGGRRRR